MAKKSLIAGEYIIEIADNGHVGIVRVYRNAMVVMEEIAKSKNFAVNEKWNTQDLGRHLIKEFGDGKTAQFGGDKEFLSQIDDIKRQMNSL